MMMEVELSRVYILIGGSTYACLQFSLCVGVIWFYSYCLKRFSSVIFCCLIWSIIGRISSFLIFRDLYDYDLRLGRSLSLVSDVSKNMHDV